MKKIILIFTAFILTISLAGCGSFIPSPNKQTVATNNTESASEVNITEEVTTEPALESAVAYEITDSSVALWKDSIGTSWVQTIVEITNTGSEPLYLGSGSYDLEDSEGKLIASQSLVSTYPNVLAPGEKGYMYEETTFDKDVDGELTVIPRVDAKEAKVDLIRLSVSDTEISNGSYGDLEMLGRVENCTDETQSMVYIVAFLYDEAGSCIGQMFTILMDDLAAGEKVGFEMSSFSMPDTITASAVADYVVYAFPYQYQF